MTGLTNWSFKNKAAIFLLVMICLIAGAVSYMTLPMEFLPSQDNPSVTITTIGQGYDAKSMEKQVTEPLEKALSAAKGHTNVFSTSGDGYSQIQIAFTQGTDMERATADVKASIDRVPFPPRVMKPFVFRFNTSMIPISWVTVSFEDGLTAANMDIVESDILSEFNTIKGIGNVNVSGRATPTVAIEPDAARLAAKGVPYLALMGVLEGRSVSASIGEQTMEGVTGNVILQSSIRDIESIGRLPVAPGVLLSDVATVRESIRQESLSRVNGEEVLLITVSKDGDSNAVAVGKEVAETAERLSEEIPGASIQVLSSTADSIVDSVNAMMQEVLLGALFATIVILLFLRNGKATLITIVSIPLSMAIALYLLKLSGITLNVITLGGVAVAVGRLVDDSIVVIENIFRRLQKEKLSTGVLISATGEVAKAITSSTLTTVAVFLPMGLLRGTLQAFLLPFALTVTYSLLASLIVALTVVPLLSGVLLKRPTMKERQAPVRYLSFIRWNLNHKWVPLLIASLLFVGSIAAYLSMPKGAVDSSSAANLSVTLEYPQGTPSDQLVEGGTRLEKFLIDQEELDWVSMTSGNSSDMARNGAVVSPNVVSFLIQVKEGADAERLIDNVNGLRPQFPEAELNAGALDFASSGSSTQITIDITGSDPEALRQAAALVTENIASVEGVRKVKSNQEAKKPVYAFEMDPAAAKAGEVASQLQAMLTPLPIGSVVLGGHETSVVLGPLVKPQTVDELADIRVTVNGNAVPLSSVAKLTKTESSGVYYHKDGETYARVTATVEPSRLSLAGDEIDERLAGLQLPDGVELHVGGASAEQSQDFADLGLTAVLSIFVVYLIMVITFKTLRAPLVILFSLPLAVIGAVPALMIAGVTPDFTAAFGALMLVGIVVTNAIVLIDRVKQNESHLSIRESLLEAVGSRVRPILMTAIATICAMLPLILGHSESGSIVSTSMAVVVVGGLTTATLLTLVVVPCIYELFHFRTVRRQQAARGEAAIQG